MTAAPRPSVGHVEPVFRPPPDNPRFPLFDGLRAFAALTVVAVHVAGFTFVLSRGWQGAFLHQLAAGVTVFFLISGFLLYRPFVAGRILGSRSPTPRQFARRRLLRIVPAYWFALTCLAIWPGLPGHVFGHDWWRYYFFGQDYSSRTVNGGIGPAWSLGTEMTFYAILPLYAAVIARGTRRRDARFSVSVDILVLLSLSIGSFAFREWRAAYVGNHNWLGQTIAGSFDWFAIGMAFAGLSVLVAALPNEPRLVRGARNHPALFWSGSAACWVLSAIWWKDHRASAWASDAYTGGPLHLLWGLSALLLIVPAVFGAERSGLIRGLLRSRLAIWLGLISYGIYLWHAPLLQRAFNFSYAHPQLHVDAVVKTGAVALAISCAAFSYYVVERPFLRRKEKPAARRASPTVG